MTSTLSPPSQFASSQQSVLGYPLQSPLWEVRAWDSAINHPHSSLPLFPPETEPHLSATAPTNFNSDSANVACTLQPENGICGSNLRIRPTGRRQEMSWARSSIRHLSKGCWRFFPREPPRLDSLGTGTRQHSCSCEVQPFRTGPSLEHSLLDMNPVPVERSSRPGMRLSIDHRDRHWTFILRTTCPPWSPQPTTDGRALVYDPRRPAENLS